MAVYGVFGGCLELQSLQLVLQTLILLVRQVVVHVTCILGRTAGQFQIKF